MAKKRDDFDEMEKELEDAQKESKEFGSGMFGSIFKDDADIKIFKCKNGEHVLDIIPYRVGKFDPTKNEGKHAYVLNLFVHKNVGATNEQMVCPARNYKKKCPICEEVKRLQDEEDAPFEEYKDLLAKKVNVFNIWCDDNDDERDKGVQVWSISHFFMEEKLQGRATNKRTGERVFYASPRKGVGRSIGFTRKGKGKGKVEFTDHEFIKRDYSIPKEILDEAVILDEVIHIPSYEEIYELFYGEPYKEGAKRKKRRDEDEDEDERPRRKRHSEDDEDIDDDEHSVTCPGKGEFGVDLDELTKCKKCELWDDCAQEHEKLNKKKKRRRDEDEDEEEEKPKKKRSRDDDEDEEEEKPRKKKRPRDDEDDDEDEKPKKKKRSRDEDEDDEEEKPRKKKRPRDEDDDEEDEEDEKPKKKKRSRDDEDEDEKPKKKKRPRDEDEDDD